MNERGRSRCFGAGFEAENMVAVEDSEDVALPGKFLLRVGLDLW